MMNLLIALYLATAPLKFDAQDGQGTRVLQFENESVRVWRTIISKNHPLAMHRHDLPRVAVTLKGGTFIKVQSTGEKSVGSVTAGGVSWLPTDPAGVLHDDQTTSDEPLEFIVIELKK